MLHKALLEKIQNFSVFPKNLIKFSRQITNIINIHLWNKLDFTYFPVLEADINCSQINITNTGICEKKWGVKWTQAFSLNFS